MDINRVVLIGRLTRDPELRHTPGGDAVATLAIAINSRRKKGDEWVDHADFFDVDVWGGQAEPCAQYLAKGKRVAVEGKLAQQRWEKDGEKRSKVIVKATAVQFVERRDEGGRHGDDYDPTAVTDADFA